MANKRVRLVRVCVVNGNRKPVYCKPETTRKGSVSAAHREHGRQSPCSCTNALCSLKSSNLMRLAGLGSKGWYRPWLGGAIEEKNLRLTS